MEPLVALNRPDQVDSVPVFGVIDQWTYEGNLLAIERNRDLSLGLGKWAPTPANRSGGWHFRRGVGSRTEDIGSPFAIVLEIDGSYYPTSHLAARDDSHAEKIW